MDEQKRAMIDAVKAGLLENIPAMRKLNCEIPVSGERRNLTMPDREIPIVYYKAEKEHAPLIIGFHGGGYMLGGAALNDDMWLAVRDSLEMNVASVDYRKSPEYQWKEALDDAYDASVYLKEHASEFGFDPEKIYVMGTSSGGGLAASVCLYANRQKNNLYTGQILLYPFLDTDTDPDSKGEGSLTGPIMYVFNELHCSPQESKNPLVSPVFALQEDLIGLPPAILVYAENDNLKTEGRQYAEMLRGAGVPVADQLVAGMSHGYFDSGFTDPSELEHGFLSMVSVSESDKKLLKDGSFHTASLETLEFIKENL